MAFLIIFGIVAKRVLMMRIDLSQLAVTSGASFVAQVGRPVQVSILGVESSEYEMAIREYQKAMSAQVVKLAAKGEVARTVRLNHEGVGSAAGKK